ncbi:MAG: hypothetical protein ACJAZ8_001518 [Planctomycetota bacterium]|jgi:hypothetical protein
MKWIDPSLSPARRRLYLGFGVTLISIAAVGLLYFVLNLSEEGRFRVRVDLSEVGRNTLDQTTMDQLEKLEEPVTAHVFFRYENTVQSAAAGEARSRMMDLLRVASVLNAGKFKVEVQDMDDLVSARSKMQEFGAEDQSIILDQGGRRAMMRLVPDICELSPSNAERTQWKVNSFKGEEALVEGLLKVGTAERPSILFSSGHGEGDPESAEPLGMGQFGRALAGDGFTVGVWDSGENGAIPEDTTILVIIAPEDPFAPEEIGYIRRYVDAGGRLLVIPGQALFRGPGSMGELLHDYGMLTQPGITCIPILDPDRNVMVVRDIACADFFVGDGGLGLSASHSITKPIRDNNRKTRVSWSRSFDRGQAPAGGVLLDLMTSPRETWLDLPDERGNYDQFWDVTEPRGSVRLAMAAEFPVGERANSDEANFDNPPERARIVAVACADFAANALFNYNRDFLLNSANWLAEREFNVRVRRYSEERTIMDVTRGTEIVQLRRVAWWGLPGLFALVGIFLAWRRRD